nr:MAG TPA: hypothetical protein [Caudoviricetes sp.]
MMVIKILKKFIFFLKKDLQKSKGYDIINT